MEGPDGQNRHRTLCQHADIRSRLRRYHSQRFRRTAEGAGNRKSLPTIAISGGRSLADISGPGSVIGESGLLFQVLCGGSRANALSVPRPGTCLPTCRTSRCCIAPAAATICASRCSPPTDRPLPVWTPAQQGGCPRYGDCQRSGVQPCVDAGADSSATDVRLPHRQVAARCVVGLVRALAGELQQRVDGEAAAIYRCGTVRRSCRSRLP